MFEYFFYLFSEQNLSKTKSQRTKQKESIWQVLIPIQIWIKTLTI